MVERDLPKVETRVRFPLPAQYKKNMPKRYGVAPYSERAMRKKRSTKKRPLIITGAYLEICQDCRSHAIIITASGKATKDFGSKKSGHELIGYLLEFRLITKEDEVFLRATLNESKLMEKDRHKECEFSSGDFMQEDPDATPETQHKEWIN